jgi:signal transduction histidine kinase
MSSNGILQPGQRPETFVFTLAHELRRPLASLSYAAEILRSAPASAVALHAIAVIQRQTDHMIRMVEDLLDAGRWAHGALSLRTTEIDLRAAVDEAASDVRATVARHRRELVVDTGDQPLWVNADPDRLRQVLMNLIDNAIKYTQPGGKIQVTTEGSSNTVVLRVNDTGRGLDPSHLTQIFEPFVQVGPTDHLGIGIGLSVVRDIVTLHRGAIEAQSDGVGRGTEFTVTLPRVGAPVDARADRPSRRHEPLVLSGAHCRCSAGHPVGSGPVQTRTLYAETSPGGPCV